MTRRQDAAATATNTPVMRRVAGTLAAVALAACAPAAEVAQDPGAAAAEVAQDPGAAAAEVTQNPGAPASQQAPSPASPLDFELPAVGGGQVRGADYADRDLIVWFWAPW